MIRFDLTSAYHFIDLYYPHTDFMGFSWVDKEGNVVFYKFLVLPFGLSSACYVFSKICRPLAAKWRSSCLSCFAVFKPFSRKPASKVVHRQPGGQKYS